MINSVTNGVLRTIVGTLQTPVVLVLLIMLVLTIIMAGSFAVEFFTERKLLTENIPKLIEKINTARLDEVKDIIKESHILNRQKAAINKLIDADDMDDATRESYAAQLLFDEEEHYRKYLRHAETLLKLGPMFGLLGTLIPLGPGLIALGKGNTQALSESLLVAFDTTSLGVIISAIAFVIYQLRKSWYNRYSVGLESIMETIINKQKEGSSNNDQEQ